jgi:hypothetical protein
VYKTRLRRGRFALEATYKSARGRWVQFEEGKSYSNHHIFTRSLALRHPGYSNTLPSLLPRGPGPSLSLCSIETLLAFLKCLICGSSFCWLLIVRRSRVLFLVRVATSDLKLVFQSRIFRFQFRSLCSIPGFLHCSLVLCTSTSIQAIDSNVVSYTAALCRFYSQRLTHRIVSCHFVSTITPPGKEGDSAQHVLSCE